MSKDSSTERALQARVAANARWSKDPEAHARDRAELATLKLERHIQEVLEAAPPLTAEQRDRLRTLLADA